MSYANSGPPPGRGCGPRSSANCILLTHVNCRQNLSSAAAGVAPKVRAAEDNTAERCADARTLCPPAYIHY